ncbi:MAG: GTP pyrophosphokinase [Bacillota bacterium]|nr:GTP pyrophosphokinase [Bacillota bacterium]
MGKLLDKAIKIAVDAHSSQLDKAGSNYIFHPLRVMLKLNSEEERIVGVLHDVIEDTDITYEFLKAEGFSKNIIEALKNVTKLDNESYMVFIKRAKSNEISRAVKLADLEDNMDMSRINNPTEKDYMRLEKYMQAKTLLLDDNYTEK